MSEDESAVKCPICEKFTTAEIISINGMCLECNKVLGSEAEDPIADEVVEDSELAGAVEKYRKHQAYIKQYNSRPDVKEKRKAYMKKRNEEQKRAVKRAKDAGLL